MKQVANIQEQRRKQVLAHSRPFPA